MTEETIKAAEKLLAKQDPILGKLIKSQKLIPRQPRRDYFHSLARSITGQQISVAAANAIFTRLEQATQLKPAKVLNLTDEDTKTIGLSKQKISYIRDLAQHFHDDPAVYNHLEAQPDEQVIKELVDVKGIGTWTAQMFLMFTLARPDVFAVDDIGLQRAMLKLYAWEALPPKIELERIAEAWKPYRTVASWHLWQSLHNKPL